MFLLSHPVLLRVLLPALSLGDQFLRGLRPLQDLVLQVGAGTTSPTVRKLSAARVPVLMFR